VPNCRILLIVVCFTFLSVKIAAQPIQIRGGFQGDSIHIGKPINYFLTASYPRKIEVVFPDSTYDFSPFELKSKTFFNTRSDSLLSFDSVVYLLTSFEIDQVQRLALPVFVIKDGDSIIWDSNPDSVFLAELITILPDSLDLKSNTSFSQVARQFNYPYLITGLAIFVILALGVFLIFGKKIRKGYLLYRLNKSHQKFIAKFRQLVGELEPDMPSSGSEKILVLWKKYMERLEKKPFTKLTTKEILASQENKPLSKPLKMVDENIYGNISRGNIKDCFEDLEYFSGERYNFKIEKVKNG